MIPVFQRVSTFYQISAIMKISGVLFPALQVVGALFALAGTFLPDPKHAEILKGLRELSNKIDLVRGDIRELKEDITWEITEHKYVDKVLYIGVGMEFCFEIGNASDNMTRELYQKRLVDLCSQEACYIALNFILSGMIGTERLDSSEGSFESNIFEDLNRKTEGNRPRIVALGVRLLKVVVGGMVVISTYETMVHGKEGAAHILGSLCRRLNTTVDKVKHILDICVKNFDRNMLNDLNKKLDKGGSNKDLATEISQLMNAKYDWLETVVLVYNDLVGSDKHCLNGYRVESLHRNGKCGIVFYQDKNKEPKVSDRYAEASTIAHWARGYKQGFDAQQCYDTIAAHLKTSGIEWRGLAVIGKPDDAQLWYVNSFSTKIIYCEETEPVVDLLSLIVRVIMENTVLAKIFLLLA